LESSPRERTIAADSSTVLAISSTSLTAMSTTSLPLLATSTVSCPDTAMLPVFLATSMTVWLISSEAVATCTDIWACSSDPFDIWTALALSS